MKTGIALTAGGFKGAFAHGVMSALEKEKISFSAYSGASVSSYAAITGALGEASNNMKKEWELGLSALFENGFHEGPTIMIDTLNERVWAHNGKELWNENSPELYITVSKVNLPVDKINLELGEELQEYAKRKDSSWAENNLQPFQFSPESISMTKFNDVITASCRLLYVWGSPTIIDGEAYIDSSYTESCPITPLLNSKCDKIIAVSTNSYGFPASVFKRQDERMNKSNIYRIVPTIDPSSFGVGTLSGTIEDVWNLFDHGEEIGYQYANHIKEFLEYES